MEKSIEKSEEQADIIKSIAVSVSLLDLEYCKSVAKDLKDNCSQYDSMAALNKNYTPLQSKLMYLQANALLNLVKYVDNLKEIDSLKAEIVNEKNFHDNFSKMFGIQ